MSICQSHSYAKLLRRPLPSSRSGTWQICFMAQRWQHRLSEFSGRVVHDFQLVADVSLIEVAVLFVTSPRHQAFELGHPAFRPSSTTRLTLFYYWTDLMLQVPGPGEG